MILIILLSTLLQVSPAANLVSPEKASVTVQDKKVKKTETVTFSVSMHCKNCVAKITDNISFLKGVEDLKVSLDQKTVTITYNPAKTDEVTLQKAIEKLGYTAEIVKEPAAVSDQVPGGAGHSVSAKNENETAPGYTRRRLVKYQSTLLL